MAAYEPKTKPTAVSPDAYVAALDNAVRKRDAERLLSVLRDLTGAEPRMWGSSMIGFGSYHYRYDSGHEGDSFVVGFAPRKAETVVYLMGAISGRDDYEEILSRLGPHRMGKSCLYIRTLDKIDMDVLTELAKRSIAAITAKYPTSFN